MRKRTPGRPFKHEIRRNTSIASFRLPDDVLASLDKVRAKLEGLCGIKVGRSMMVELLIAGGDDIEKYRKILEDD